ncbi:MAG: metal ABC transporter permease [Gammaproteobacteria bacterium]|nr:metal ABC transporter permease [Gammaproteobacteria bacterium]
MSLSLLVEQLPILIPAFLAGLLVLATHVPLGAEILRRGIIFMDLAIAQTAAAGIILGRWAATNGLLPGEGAHGHGGGGREQLLAYGSAIAGAALLYTSRRASARVQEALIGSLFVLAATGGILLLSGNPHGGEQLKEALVGQILWIQPRELVPTAVISLLVLIASLGFRRRMGEFGFYPLFAVAVTLSTQLVGIYLVFATLIIPALAARGYSRHLAAAYLVGIAGYASGLAVSALLDLPSGAAIVWLLAAWGGAAWLGQRLLRGGFVR